MILTLDKYSYPHIDRVTNDDGTRYYTCPESGNPLASVTTILSATADKQFLIDWENRVGKKEADLQRKFGSNLGTLVHAHLEAEILGQDRPIGNSILRKQSKIMADALIEKCFSSIDEVWGIETALYYPGLFAGTTDVVGVHDGEAAIMDHKNTKKMKKKEDIVDYRDQISAYIIAHNEKYGTDIRKGVVFMVARDLKVETHIWRDDEIKRGCESFLNRVEKYLRSGNL